MRVRPWLEALESEVLTAIIAEEDHPSDDETEARAQYQYEPGEDDPDAIHDAAEAVFDLGENEMDEARTESSSKS